MKEIAFNHVTKDGIIQSKGEFIECNGYQYALHYFEGNYDAIELSTGYRVCFIDSYTEIVDGIQAKDYLIQRIKEIDITPDVISNAKLRLKVSDIDFPVNNRF